MNYDFKSTNLDDVFYGAGTALNTAYAAANIVADGWNTIRNCMDSSRRNMQPYNYGYGCNYYGGYMQPVPYGYGYADYGCPSPAMSSSFNYGMNPTYMNNGYFGFTDPSYGAISGMDSSFNMGMAPNSNFNNPNFQPQGGSWGL